MTPSPQKSGHVTAPKTREERSYLEFYPTLNINAQMKLEFVGAIPEQTHNVHTMNNFTPKPSSSYISYSRKINLMS